MISTIDAHYGHQLHDARPDAAIWLKAIALAAWALATLILMLTTVYAGGWTLATPEPLDARVQPAPNEVIERPEPLPGFGL